MPARWAWAARRPWPPAVHPALMAVRPPPSGRPSPSVPANGASRPGAPAPGWTTSQSTPRFRRPRCTGGLRQPAPSPTSWLPGPKPHLLHHPHPAAWPVRTVRLRQDHPLENLRLGAKSPRRPEVAQKKASAATRLLALYIAAHSTPHGRLGLLEAGGLRLGPTTAFCALPPNRIVEHVELLVDADWAHRHDTSGDAAGTPHRAPLAAGRTAVTHQGRHGRRAAPDGGLYGIPVPQVRMYERQAIKTPSVRSGNAWARERGTT